MYAHRAPQSNREGAPLLIVPMAHNPQNVAEYEPLRQFLYIAYPKEV